MKEEVTPAAPVDAMSVIETMDTPELPVQRTGRRTRRSLTSMRWNYQNWGFVTLSCFDCSTTIWASIISIFVIAFEILVCYLKIPAAIHLPTYPKSCDCEYPWCAVIHFGKIFWYLGILSWCSVNFTGHWFDISNIVQFHFKKNWERVSHSIIIQSITIMIDKPCQRPFHIYPFRDVKLASLPHLYVQTFWKLGTLCEQSDYFVENTPLEHRFISNVFMLIICNDSTDCIAFCSSVIVVLATSAISLM